jgi:hypothetical protein
MMKTEPKNCIACGSELNKGAAVCHACASSQRFWRNELRYWATVAGVFSVIAAMIGYSINVAPEIRKTLLWQDNIEILQFSETGDGAKISIANIGDGPVWVEKLSFQAGGSFAQHLDVARTIQPGDVLNEDLYTVKSGAEVCFSAVQVEPEDTAEMLNDSFGSGDWTAEFVTNPDPELMDLGVGIPGSVSVRFLSLKTNSFQVEETDLYAVLFEHYDCD